MRAIVLLLLTVAPPPLMAEVSDKMPTIMEILLQGAIVGVALFLLSSLRWWLVVPGLAIAFWFVASTVALWLEVPMPEALIHEQGIRYFAFAVAADLLVLLGATGGVVFGRRRRSRQ